VLPVFFSPLCCICRKLPGPLPPPPQIWREISLWSRDESNMAAVGHVSISCPAGVGGAGIQFNALLIDSHSNN
jgi:hypothetical protein